MPSNQQFGVEHRDILLAWTSLWMLVPGLTWELPCIFECGRCEANSLASLLLPLGAAASFFHWSNNVAWSAYHGIDVTLTVTLATLFTSQLWVQDELVLIGLTVIPMGVAFVRQWEEQCRLPVDWFEVTVWHLTFRYFAFWLAMFSVLPKPLTVGVVLLAGMVFTLLYVKHIEWLLALCAKGNKEFITA